MNKKYLLWLLTFLLMLSLAACGGGEEEPAADPTAVPLTTETTEVVPEDPTAEPEPTEEPTAVPEPEPEPTDEPEPEPTAEPEPTVEPTPAVNQFEQDGVAFVYDPDLNLNNIRVDRVPAQQLGAEGGPVYFMDVPEFIRLTLDTAQGPGQLLVQPIRNQAGEFFSTLPADLLDFYTAFETQLAEEGPGRLDQQQLEYLEFGDGGLGLRAISYRFDVNPAVERITNQNLFYFFDGFTGDGRYYVSLAYPVDASILEDSGLLTPEQESDALADFDAFIAASMAPLAELETSDFTPDLTLLDEMVESIKIAPNASTEVSELANDPNCTNDATFVRDVTIPDATPINASEPFEKIWEVVNSGTCIWNSAYTATFLNGDTLGWTGFVQVERVAPGELFQIAVDLEAPQIPGIYEGRWQMINEVGEPFGVIVYVTIVVPEEPIETEG